MPNFQARIKSEYLQEHPDLTPGMWYDVIPIFPGLPERTVNMAGDRLTRIRTRRGFVLVLANHLDVRHKPAGEPAGHRE